MPALRPRARRVLIAGLALAALTATAATANTRFPNIHPPTLSADAPEFGGLFDLYIGNSNDDTAVTACVSNHCRRLFQDGNQGRRNDPCCSGARRRATRDEPAAQRREVRLAVGAQGHELAIENDAAARQCLTERR